MREIPRWSSERREVALNAFFMSQAKAEAGFWYVPYKTGVAIVDSFELIVATHLGQELGESIEVVRQHSGTKLQMMTSDIYECASVFASFGSDLKILIHAYGPESLWGLMNALEREIPISFLGNQDAAKGKLLIAYNPYYFLNACRYERICSSFARRFKGMPIKRRWINHNNILKF